MSWIDIAAFGGVPIILGEYAEGALYSVEITGHAIKSLILVW